jgi:hypothetical protein
MTAPVDPKIEMWPLAYLVRLETRVVSMRMTPEAPHSSHSDTDVFAEPLDVVGAWSGSLRRTKPRGPS